jgi:hypothetical protein
MGLTNSYVVEPSGRVTRDTRSGRTYKKPKNLRVCEGEDSGCGENLVVVLKETQGLVGQDFRNLGRCFLLQWNKKRREPWKKCHDLRILENKLKIKKIYLEDVLQNSSSSKNEKTHKYMGPNATHLVLLAPHQNAP